MSSPEGVVALVPLRGGSRSIPGKNIRPIAGRPLCHWALSAALAARGIARVVVSTDSSEIAAVARALDPRVEVLDRPAALATDTASTESVMLHALEHLPCRTLATLQATSPLTTAADLEAALARFAGEGLDSLVTAVRVRRFYWGDDARPINYDPLRRPRRQDFAGTLMENGAFYLTDAALLRRTACRLGGRIGVHEMPADCAAELDEPEDWEVVARVLLRRRHATACRSIATVVLDVDGTLTDGGMWYGPDGEALKRFDTRDGFGIRRLREAGLRVVLCTGEDSPIVRARAAKLGVAEVHGGVADKAAALRAIAAAHGIGCERIAMVGDDLNDLPAIALAGFSACPADARPEVRSACSHVLAATGGHAAVRECCDLILALRAG